MNAQNESDLKLLTRQVEMTEKEKEELKSEAEALPPLRVDGGYYPVDVDATISTGWKTYGTFVVEGEEKEGETGHTMGDRRVPGQS